MEKYTTTPLRFLFSPGILISFENTNKADNMSWASDFCDVEMGHQIISTGNRAEMAFSHYEGWVQMCLV